MAITPDSKLTLKQEINRLQDKKAFLNGKISDLKDKRDILVIQRDAIDAKITELQKDTG